MKTDTRENLIDLAWQAMDDRNDLDISLRQLAEAAIDRIAATELLEALRAAQYELHTRICIPVGYQSGDHCEECSNALAAIAKAEGK